MERRFAYCLDCGVDTLEIRDWYMLQLEVWQKVITSKDPIARRFLCILCLEKRLGRTLEAADFVDAPINKPNPKMSALLMSRVNAGR